MSREGVRVEGSASREGVLVEKRESREGVRVDKDCEKRKSREESVEKKE